MDRAEVEEGLERLVEAVSAGLVDTVPRAAETGRRVASSPLDLTLCHAGTGGSLNMLSAEGESIPGPILKIGNINSRLRFPLGTARFVNWWCEGGPTHPCALGVGHLKESVAKPGALMELPVVHVC